MFYKPISEYIEDTEPTENDFVPTVRYPYGSNSNKKVKLKNLKGSLSLGWVDIRSYKATCDGSTNDDPAIQAAISTGAKIIYLPKNTFWIPTSNTIPGGIHYIGEDWLTVVIKASNPITEYVVAEQGAILENVSIFDKTGVDIGLSPNVARPIRLIASNRITSDMPGCGGWPNQYLYLHIGEAGLDRPGIGIANYGTGDSFWSGVADSGVCYRADVNQNAPTKTGVGFYGLNFGAGNALHLSSEVGATGSLAKMVGKSGVNAILLDMQDYTTTTYSQGMIFSGKTSGYGINMYHVGSAWAAAGVGLLMNFGNGGGSFGGNFLEVRLAGVSKMSIRCDGLVESALQYNVAGIKVIGSRVIDARIDDTIGGTWDAAAQGVLDAVRDCLIAHGLGAAA